MIEIYGHPFAAFVWKPLIAAYARGIPFVFRMVDADHPENAVRLRELSPTGQMPALVDGSSEVIESNAIIEYMDQVGSSARLIPREPAASIRCRMLADVFDDYVATPMQQIVADCFQPAGDKNAAGTARARETLDSSYRWLAHRIGAPWAAGDTFSLADCAAAPALFYADWVQPLPNGHLRDYRARLLAHPAIARVIDEARPYRALFPLGAPDQD